MECTLSTCSREATQETSEGPLCHHHFMSWKKWGHIGSNAPAKCTVEGCNANHTSGGMCSKHYNRLRKYGSLEDRPRKNARKRCSVDDCDMISYSNGMCQKHYTRMRRYGIVDRPPVSVPDPVRCAQCGGERPSRRSKYCSDLCAERADFHTRVASNRKRQLRLYGITVEEYDRLLVEQDGGCAICHAGEPGSGRASFAVDHDHVTGAVRGLLCLSCNSGLGQFRDDPVLLEAAVRYLQHEARPIAVA